MKKTGMLIAGLIFSLAGYSQTRQEQPDKQIQDQQRRADAGKADAIIARRKNIYDSTTFANDTPKTADTRTVKPGAKTKRIGKASATKKRY